VSSWVKGIVALWFVVCFAGGFLACSSGDSDSNVAGGVTDIGNSVAYSGHVYDSDGKAVARARVVAYYDDWKKSEIRDSVETVSDDGGAFELMLDSAAEFVLFASLGDESGIALPVIHENADDATIVIGKSTKYSGHIAGRNTGSVRVVGSNITTELDGDGYFIFYDMPQGDVLLVYTDTTDGAELQSSIVFSTVENKDIYVLPELEIQESDSSSLVSTSAQYYEEKGNDGIKIYEKPSAQGNKHHQVISVSAQTKLDSLDGFVAPLKVDFEKFSDSVKATDLAAFLVGKESSLTALPSEMEFWNDGEALLWVRLAGKVNGKKFNLKLIENEVFAASSPAMDSVVELDGVAAHLHMNGDAKVYEGAALADAVADSAGLFGKGLTLKPGQFIGLDSLDFVGGDFTITLWTKWNGANESSQVLVDHVVSEGDFGDKVPVDAWTYLVVVSKDGKLSLYVDGSLVSEKEFALEELDDGILRIGGSADGEGTWNGALDEVRVVTKAYDAEWISAQYEIIKGLL